MTNLIKYSVHKFYVVKDTDNYMVADEEFMRAYKGNFINDAAVLDSVLINRTTEVDGVQTESAISMDDGKSWSVVVRI
jgi:hypothetical protein